MTRKTHFGFAGAREMTLDEPLTCPAYGALSFDGLAVDDVDRLHLIMRARDIRFYLGPDRSDVIRRIEIVTAALVRSGDVRADRVPEIAAWLWECRLSAVDEIVATRGGSPESSPGGLSRGMALRLDARS